jgi:lysozyme family protein
MTMLLAHEGGYVNHPSDPGGMTNLGVTKRTYDEYHGTDIDEEGMRNLTKADVIPIYRRNYWERCRCQDLASGIDWATFDASVNHGTGRAARLLQRAVETTQDGSIGPLTLMKVKQHEVTNIINRIAVYREEFYRSLDTFDTFGRGWLRRNDETREQALNMG